ncbi:MAG: archaellin/type IV pilin N-terminal domain-containing protein [Candidatus Bathyarchaeales archaeon]
MNIHKRFNHEKAISPILATLLLIVIAVAATVITYAWITTYMGSTTQQASFIPYKANVNFIGGSTKQIAIDIGNSGTATGQIVKVYIGESPTTTQAYETNPATITIEPNTVVSFTVNFDWQSKQTYYFKVVPSSGATLSFTEQAP